MKKIFLATIALVAAQGALAAPAAKLTPMEVLQKAVSCELPIGKFKDVVKAIKALKGKAEPGGNYYALPFTVWGRQASGVAIDDQDVEIYTAVFKDVPVKELALSAGMKAGEESRRGKHGELIASDHGKETWVSCTASNEP